jgi:hypothetical protein
MIFQHFETNLINKQINHNKFLKKEIIAFCGRWNTRRSGWWSEQSRGVRRTDASGAARRPQSPAVDVASARDGGARAGRAAAPEPERAGQPAGGPAPRAAVDAARPSPAAAAAAGEFVVDAEREPRGALVPAAAAGQQHLRHAQHGAQGALSLGALAQTRAHLLPHQEGARPHQSAIPQQTGKRNQDSEKPAIFTKKCIVLHFSGFFCVAFFG